MNRSARWIVAAGCCGALCAPLAAQTARSGGGASAQLLQQMQQLASERTTLQAENDKLKSELADVKKDRDALKAAQTGVDRRARDAVAALEHSSAEREATDQELTQSKAKMQELIAKFRETLQKMREIETDDTAQRQALATREHDLSVCVDHNKALYHLDDEALTRLEKQGVFSRVAQSEPFTKIKRIQLENFVDESRDRAQGQLVTPPAPSPPPGPPPAAPAPPPEVALPPAPAPAQPTSVAPASH
jgi:chromosome segregation ATPase